MLSYRQLEHFVAVAQELHFSRAADRLGIAQSAVSVQIQQLEQQLGVRLLQRNKRKPITLTDAGELLYDEAVAVLRHMERAQQIGQLAAQGMSGHVKLGYISSAVTSGMLARVLTRFRPGHEQVHMQVLAMETPRQLQALQLGEIDAGLLRPRRRYPEGVQAVIVHSEPFMVAMADSHALARQESVSVADLRGQTFIAPQFLNESEGFAEVLARLAETAGFSAREAYRVNDFVTATSLAAAGYGIVVLPESNRLLNQPGVSFRPLRDFGETVHMALAYRERENSPAVRAFLAVARSCVE
ncbi:MAG: LysR family transcriptional regulator [Comamonas sp.]|nr:LysR family transcriptional regulator [Comamonas sp.]